MMSKRFLQVLICLPLLSGCWPYAWGQFTGLPPDLASDPEAAGLADLLLAQGVVRYADRDYAAALALFEKAATATPGDETFGYFAGLCMMRLGRYDEAIGRLAKVLPPASSRIPEPRVHHDLGTAHYLAGHLDEAERELGAALTLDDADALSHYYLGLALFAGNDAERAVKEFERAIALDPKLAGDGSYYLGVSAHQRGDLQAARGHFETTVGSAADRNLAASSRDWLGAIHPSSLAPPAPRGELRVGVSLAYDDNPARLEETFLNTPPLSSVPGLDTDTRGELQFRAGLLPWAPRAGWTLGVVANGYASRHRDLEGFDLEGGRALFQAAWGQDPLGYVNGPLEYARVSPGESRFGLLFQAGSTYFSVNDQPFRRDHELSASFFIRQVGFGKSQVDLIYDDRTFLGSNGFAVLDGSVRTVRLGQYFGLGARPDRILRVAVSRADVDAFVDTFDAEVSQVLAELALPLSRRWTLFVFGARSREDYDPESATFYGEERRDDRSELSATAVLGITKHLYATLQAAWIDHQVRPEAFLLSYDRVTGSAGITWHW